MTTRAKVTARHLVKKAATVVKKREEELLAVLSVFICGIIPLGDFHPFGYAFYLAMDKHCGASFWALAASVIFTVSHPIGIPVAVGLYTFKRLVTKSAPLTVAKPLAAVTAAAFLWATEADNGLYPLASSVPVLVTLPLFTLLYGFAFGVGAEKSSLKHGGYSAILLTAVLFIKSFLPFSALPQTAALFVGLSAALKGGMLYGGLYGFVCGLGCGSGSAAVCGVYGLVSGLFTVSGKITAILFGAFGALCCGFYFFGFDKALYVFGCLAGATALYAIFRKRIDMLPFDSIPVNEGGNEKGKSPLAEAFLAISQNAVKAAASEAEAARTADPYANISGLLNAAAKKEVYESHTDAALSSKAGLMLYGAGVRADCIKVSGGRRKLLIAEGVDITRLSLSSDKLKELISTAVGCPMKEPRFTPSGEKARLTMESAPLYRIECSRKGSPKKGEEVCGDTVCFFSNGDGYFYALISDGMGSGRAAAKCSGLAGIFLEKLLTAGADRRAALSLLNNFLAAREEEVFATVDLFEADLYTGKGVIVKAGAAPSFILRDGVCNRLQSATVPAGIIRDIKAEQLSFDLKSGDTLVMLSDGISGAGDGDEAKQLLSTLPPQSSTAHIADKLLSDSLRRGGSKDDMSVCVIRILAA